MTTFLTSSPTRELDREHPAPALDERNDFIVRLRRVWPERGSCLMIAAFAGEHARNDEMTAFYRDAVENAGLPVSRFDLWDDRQDAGEMASRIGEYDVIFLAGGHVPTQNRWFAQLGLRGVLARFDGVVVGTSAGSMNGAETVYAWPEEPGESMLPEEELFLPGLGLASTIVLPHYQKLKNSRLDGKRLMEDITYPHSVGRRFLAIPDGSYVLARDGQEWVFGEAHLIEEGRMRCFCREGEQRELGPFPEEK